MNLKIQQNSVLCVCFFLNSISMLPSLPLKLKMSIALYLELKTMNGRNKKQNRRILFLYLNILAIGTLNIKKSIKGAFDKI